MQPPLRHENSKTRFFSFSLVVLFWKRFNVVLCALHSMLFVLYCLTLIRILCSKWMRECLQRVLWFMSNSTKECTNFTDSSKYPFDRFYLLPITDESVNRRRRVAAEQTKHQTRWFHSTRVFYYMGITTSASMRNYQQQQESSAQSELCVL